MSEGSDVESFTDAKTPTTEPHTPLGAGGKNLLCPYEGCTKSFNRQARLTEHIRSHTNERPFKCPEKECGKAFLRDSHLKHHITSAHMDDRKYPCTWANCDKKFATGTRLRRHEASHEVKEKYTCKGFEGCNETFRKHATLSRHILSVHEMKKPFPCTEHDMRKGEQCSMGFDTAEKLRSHKRAVHDQTRFACVDCAVIGAEVETPVSFPTYALLRNHIAEVHPPTCSHCSLLCASEKDLRRHLELSHNMADPQSINSPTPAFPCTFPDCTRSFTKKGNLNVHVKTVHEHRKDFVCGATEIKLPHETLQTVKSELGEHSEITGCGRHFTSKATLEEHVRTVHLGMNSKRAERNKKRRAERVADVEHEEVERGGRTRKRRKGKGAKSAIAQLTGSTCHAATLGFEAQSVAQNSFDAPTYYSAEDNHSHESREDFAAENFLQLDFDPLLTSNELEERKFTESTLGMGLNSLAASALVDPLLLR